MPTKDAERDAAAEPPGIGLADMITSLRRELLEAQTDPATAQLALRTGTVELELQVAVTRTTKGRAGIRFWVIDAGADHGRERVATQTFKIALDPIDPTTGERAAVADEERIDPTTGERAAIADEEEIAPSDPE